MDLATFRGLLGDLGLGMTDHEVNNLFTQLGEDLALATGARSLVSVDDSALPRAASSSSLGTLSPPMSPKTPPSGGSAGPDSPRRRRSFADAQRGPAARRRRRRARQRRHVHGGHPAPPLPPAHRLALPFTEPAAWACPGYDYNRSTTENYAAPLDAGFVGELVDIRARLDAAYHGNYGHARQLWQGGPRRGGPARGPRPQCALRAEDRPVVAQVGEQLAEARRVRGAEPAPVARLHQGRKRVILRRFNVFTCGAMGAGKGWVMNWMSTLDILPLRSIVHIDPDRFKQMMPEWAGHVRRDAASAGTRCHKESGLLAELAQELAMRHRLHVWVDGSLRDHGWYEREFDELRAKHPTYKIALFYVHAKEATVRARVKTRAARVGERHVPEQSLADSIAAPPHVLRALTPKVDFVARIDNDGDAPILEAFESVDTTGSWKVVAHMFGGTYGIPRRPCRRRRARRATPARARREQASPGDAARAPRPVFNNPFASSTGADRRRAERRGTPK
ncbi:zeta toxin [Aureococcus anophagefferens]|nr:zeta toxin [Aureococcus anophagefferens]